MPPEAEIVSATVFIFTQNFLFMLQPVSDDTPLALEFFNRIFPLSVVWHASLLLESDQTFKDLQANFVALLTSTTKKLQISTENVYW